MATGGATMGRRNSVFLSNLSNSRSRSSIRSTTSLLVKNRRCCAFSRKCEKLVMELKARFYIMYRCVIILICWRDYSD